MIKTITTSCLIAFLLIDTFSLKAQTGEMVKGGNFKFTDMSAWTFGTNAAGESGGIEFGNTTDVPAGSKNTTCVKFTFNGRGTPEVQMYQRVKLRAGEIYKISARLKASGDMATRAAQIYVALDAQPDNGTMFSDAVMNTGVRSKAMALYLEGWPFSMSGPEVDINGEFPLSGDGPGTELMSPDADGDYLVLFKVGGWGALDPFSVTVSDLSLINIAYSAVKNMNSDKFSVYPGIISNNRLYVNSIGLDNSELKISSISGQSVLQQKVNSGKTTIDTGFLGSGMYLIQVSNGNENYINKIIIP
jgi:hypothetical protein